MDDAADASGQPPDSAGPGAVGSLETVGFREFLPTAVDIRSARHFVEETLAGCHASPEVIAGAALVADEFALNAVKHAGTFFSVVLELGPDMVRIAVRDDSRNFPQLSGHAIDSISGRGLSIVAMTAEHWGAESLGRGKEVWADLHW